MRSRVVIVMVLATLVAAIAGPALPARAGGAVLAQPKEEADTDQELIGEEEEQPRQEQRGEEDAPAETGAGQEEQEEATTPEGGPPWTHQMSWMALVLLFFMILGMGAAWYRLVGSRARSGEA